MEQKNLDQNDSMAIIDHWKSLDGESKIKFRDEVMEKTGIGYATFYNKMRRQTQFSKAEIFVIQIIIAQHNAGH